MEKYIPPFTVSHTMLKLTASVSEKVGKLSGYEDFGARPHLRRVNRIKSICSSLRIEANSLSLSEVRDVIDGHEVLGDPKEIREVRNAYAAYERIGSVDPYSLTDLEMLHGIMTEGLIPEAGQFRTGQEGVFAGDKCIFLAPPPRMVPGLMEDLFRWMRENKEKIHPLILSAVFHYEFVFMHPFSDGNGRMARLWHTVLLCAWREMFAYLPIESRIESFQNEYYSVIAECNAAGNADAFIVFMLEQIGCALDELIARPGVAAGAANPYILKMLSVMEFDIPYTAAAIMEKLNLKSKETFRKNYMNPALKEGYTVMTLPDKPQSKNQRYIRVK